MKFGILSAHNEDEDFASALAEAIRGEIAGSTITLKVMPDEITDIKFQLNSWCDSGCDIIFIIGDTGFTLQDVTAGATKLVKSETLCLVKALISKSVAKKRKEDVSKHPVCDINQETLIIYLPGCYSTGACACAVDCFHVIKDALEPAVTVIRNTKELIQKNQLSTIESPPEKQITSPSKVKLNNVISRLISYPLLEVQCARSIINKEISPSLETEVIPYEDSLNKVLAENIFVREPFPVSMTNGYAVNSSDKQKNRTIRSGDESFQEQLKEGEAVRVYIGAPIPPGADSVIQEEDTSFVGKSLSGKVEISVKSNPVAGQYMRTIGTDGHPDSLVLNQFDLITPAHIEILASLRTTKVKVFKQPSIAVISTGNEVKDPRENLEPGQIPDCHKIGIITFLQKYGFNPVDGGIIKADPNKIKSTLAQAFSNHDVVIVSNAISTGEFDILKQVLIEDFSAIIHFEGVNMTPGEFTTFATLKYERVVKYFFGLPGSNPLSYNVALIVFVIPALRYMERRKKYKFPILYLDVTGFTNSRSKQEYKMVNVSSVNGRLQCNKVDVMNSLVNSTVLGNGLALVPKNTTSVNTLNCHVICFDPILPS